MTHTHIHTYRTAHQIFLSVDDTHTHTHTHVQNGPSQPISTLCPTEIKLPLGICLPLFSKNTTLTPFSPSSLGIAVSLPEVNAVGT
jgi:hypothetical protein